VALVSLVCSAMFLQHVYNTAGRSEELFPDWAEPSTIDFGLRADLASRTSVLGAVVRSRARSDVHVGVVHATAAAAPR
jgi:hypothetical protein